jgi:integrase
MASAWIAKRKTNDGGKRYRVMFRVGGRESSPRYAGSFRTEREAKARRDFVAGELAALRVPDLRLLAPEPAPTLAAVAERWRTSRVDVATGTAATHRVNLNRIVDVLGERRIDEIRAEDVAEFVVGLSKLRRESVRKTVSTLAQVFDFHGVVPNPARDKRVRLPQQDRAEVSPPDAAHVAAVYRLVPRVYRLPLVVLEASGMRVGELESLTWGDVDEQEGRWRVSQAKAKTKAARWVPVPELVFEAVVETVPREDRDMGAQVFPGFGADRFRTAITRACKAAGVPTFSPHDLRHRRATLWHLQGVPAVKAASWLGHSAQEHLRTYAHVVVDRAELDYADPLFGRTTRASG